MLDLLNQRLRFRAKLIDAGFTHVKFTDIFRIDTNEKVSDYVRSKYNNELRKLNLKENDVVEFDATVKLIFHSYRPMKSVRCRFYRITKPTKLENNNGDH